MKVKDTISYRPTFIGIANKFGARYPEDIVQDFYLQLAEIEYKEGSIDRLVFKDSNKLNLLYCYKAIRGLTIGQLTVEDKYVELYPQENEADTALLPDDLLEVSPSTNLLEKVQENEAERYLDYIYKIYTVEELSQQENCSTSSIYNKLNNTKEKLRLAHNQRYNI